MLGPYRTEIERGRGDLVLARIQASWTSWRGRAIEPVIRDALWRSAERWLLEETGAIGGYWTRTNNPEVDLVGGDRAPVAKQITMVGSVKWLERRPFDTRDLARLVVHRRQAPGSDDSTVLFAVSRSGVADGLGVTVIGPDELLSAYAGRG